MTNDEETGTPLSEFVEFFGPKTTMISTWSRWVRLGDWFTTRLVPPGECGSAGLGRQRVRRRINHWLFHGPECEGE